MDTIENWVNPNIPFEYVVGSFLVLGIVIFMGFVIFKGDVVKRFVLWTLNLEYYFLVLCSTVICRSTPVTKRVELTPFYKYADIWNKVDYPKDLMEVLLNVALFIPIGLLLGGSLNKSKWWHIALVGMLLSSIIELLQLATRRGLCETDDLIHNTLGCIIGYGLYVGTRKLLETINR